MECFSLLSLQEQTSGFKADAYDSYPDEWIDPIRTSHFNFRLLQLISFVDTLRVWLDALPCLKMWKFMLICSRVFGRITSCFSINRIFYFERKQINCHFLLWLQQPVSLRKLHDFLTDYQGHIRSLRALLTLPTANHSLRTWHFNQSGGRGGKECVITVPVDLLCVFTVRWSVIDQWKIVM